MPQGNGDNGKEITLNELQEAMNKLFYEKDYKRGVERTFIWLVEEIGELASALKENKLDNIKEEIADIVAWTFSLANLLNINVQASICHKYPQACTETRK